MLLINNNILLNSRAPVFEPHIFEVGELPFIFHYMIEENNSPFNIHENIEFLYFVKGETQVRCGAELIPVKSGDIIAVNTYVPHKLMASKGYCCHCLIVDKKFLVENGIDPKKIFLKSFINDKMAGELFCNIVSAYLRDGALRIAEIRSAALSFLLHILKNHSAPVTASQNAALPENTVFRRIHEAIAYIKSNLSSRITVDGIAAHVHISKYHFLRQFKETTGETVINYVRFLRCDYAKRLLSSGKHTIAEAGALAGFENASYFAATFKQYIGVTPREYLKQLHK